MKPEEQKTSVFDQLPTVFDTIPVGITITDLEGRILYYNAYSAKIVDRKPEYIGKDIRECHQRAESIEKLNDILKGFKTQTLNEYYYETVRNGKDLSVTMTPFSVDGEIKGCIQSFIIKR